MFAALSELHLINDCFFIKLMNLTFVDGSAPIPLASAHINVDTSDADQRTFTISSNWLPVVFRASNRESRDAWIAALFAARHAEIKARLGHARRSGADADVHAAGASLYSEKETLRRRRQEAEDAVSSQLVYSGAFS